MLFAIDAGYEGMAFYTTGLDNRCDVPPVDIGYHYPGVVRFVDADTTAAEIDQDGLSWTTAYAYLQDALDEAGSTIITGIAVANGTYYPDEDKDSGHSNNTRTESFELVDGLALYGGFAGTENVFDFDIGTRKFGRNETILDGDIDDNNGTLDDGNSYNVVKAFYADNAILDGFTVTGGNADDNTNYNLGTEQQPINVYYYGSGGGMFNLVSELEVKNCIFAENGAVVGGAICNIIATTTITNCTIVKNEASLYAGAIYEDYYGDPTICTV